MRSMVFNAPMIAFWWTIGGSILAGMILSTFIWLCFKNRMIRKEVERRIPEELAAYKAELAEKEIIIEQNREVIERYERIHAEVILSATRIVTSIGSK